MLVIVTITIFAFRASRDDRHRSVCRNASCCSVVFRRCRHVGVTHLSPLIVSRIWSVASAFLALLWWLSPGPPRADRQPRRLRAGPSLVLLWPADYARWLVSSNYASPRARFPYHARVYWPAHDSRTRSCSGAVRHRLPGGVLDHPRAWRSFHACLGTAHSRRAGGVAYSPPRRCSTRARGSGSASAWCSVCRSCRVQPWCYTRCRRAPNRPQRRRRLAALRSWRCCDRDAGRRAACSGARTLPCPDRRVFRHQLRSRGPPRRGAIHQDRQAKVVPIVFTAVRYALAA